MSCRIALGGLLLVLTSGCFQTDKFSYDGKRELLSHYTGRCASCVETKCSPELNACANDLACVEFTHCMEENRYPTAAMDCAEGESEAPGAEQARALATCQEACGDACSLGNEWTCVGAYRPQVTVDSVLLSQRFFDPRTSKAWAGVEVRLCEEVEDAMRYRADSPDDPSVRCGAHPVLVTDERGRYEVELPIQPHRPGVVGWRGVRRVSSPPNSKERILTQVLLRNVPIWAHITEQTGLLSEAVASKYSEKVRDFVTKLAGPSAVLPKLLVTQVFDCQGYPATEARVRLRNAPHVLTLYPEPSAATVDFVYEPDPSRLTAGLAILIGLEPEKEYVLEAYVGDRVVAHSEPLRIPKQSPNAHEPESVLVVSLHPDYDRAGL